MPKQYKLKRFSENRVVATDYFDTLQQVDAEKAKYPDAIFEVRQYNRRTGNYRRVKLANKIKYECYVDFLAPTLQCTFDTLKEARMWKRDGSKNSEQWIEKVEADGTRREVH